MTRTILLSLAAALASATLCAGLAEAGEGTKLQFGYPMGTFVAKPAQGGAAAPAKPPYKAATPKVRIPARGGDDEPKLTRKRTIDKPEKDVAKATDTNSGSAEKSDTESTPGTALTGSRALANQGATAKPAMSESPVTESATSPAPPPADTAAATVTDTAASVVPAAEQKPEEPPQPSTPANTDNSSELGCKKFIPAIGVTVSVGCDK